MNIQIKSDSTVHHANLGTYRTFDLDADGQELVIVLTPRYVRVLVVNASHRAWRGMGKEFPSLDAAAANYRTAKIKAAIQTVQELTKA